MQQKSSDSGDLLYLLGKYWGAHASCAIYSILELSGRVIHKMWYFCKKARQTLKKPPKKVLKKVLKRY